MNAADILFFAAGIILGIAPALQAHRIWRIKSAHELSFLTVAGIVAGVSLNGVAIFLIGQASLFIANSLSLLIWLIVLFQKVYYMYKERL